MDRLLAVLVLAVIGFAGYKFASGVGKTQRAADATRTHRAQTGRPSLRSPVGRRPSRHSAEHRDRAVRPTATPSASPAAWLGSRP